MAQSALCPTNFPGQSGIVFKSSSCTNNFTGAYSNAALASQSLGELSQSSTQDATRAAMASISARRTSEQLSCPSGYILVSGICQPIPASRYAAEPPDLVAAAMPESLLALAPSLTAASSVLPVVEPPHWAFWEQAYGDYERQFGQSPGLGEFSSRALSVTATTGTGGVMGGLDYTVRNLASAGDGLIVGGLVGFESSWASLSSSSLSSDPASPNGHSSMKALLSGPATGVYASYFNGGFSTDTAFKAEFYSLNLSYTDFLGFQSNPDYGFPPTVVPYSSSGATRLNEYTLSNNVNYRVSTGAATWIEPTAGFQYLFSRYASGADEFGLADGSLFRLQAGARFGFEGAWKGVATSTAFTGLLYDDVRVSGGVLATSPNPLILSDQGRLRAEGIFTVSFFCGKGVTSFVQADLQGGQGLFGAGGKAGVRVAW